MGFLDRLHKVATGIGGALQAPFGLAKDLATAPFRDEEDFDGALNTLYRRTVARGGQLLGNVFGSEEGLGALVGGVPEPLRIPNRFIFGAASRGLEFAYREGISEPITTAVTVGSLADRPGGPGPIGLFRGDYWREGYRAAQNRSPGQAVALAVSTKDITNANEVARVAATDGFEITSGVTDAVLRWQLSPDVLGGKLAAVARVKYLVRPLASVDDIDNAMSSVRITKFVDALEGKNAAEIRHQFFSDHHNGSVISTILADAATGDEKRAALRAMMGDRDSLDQLTAERADLAGQIRRVVDEVDLLAAVEHRGIVLPDTGYVGDRRGALKAELDTLYDQEQLLARRDAAFATIQAVPRVSLSGQARTTITRSDWYQASPLAAPLRVAFNMSPQQFVNLETTGGDIQVARMLRRAGVDQEAADRLRSGYMAALDPPARQRALIAAETAAVRHIADQAGMTVDDIEKILTKAAQDRGRAAAVLKSRVYDGEGRSLVRFADEHGTTQEIPLLVSQEVNVLPLVDIAEVRKAASSVGAWRLRHPSTRVPGELLESFYKLWKPSVLLRVGWPIRVLADEQLRIIAKIGVLSQLRHLRTGVRNWAEDVAGGVSKAERVPGIRGFTYAGYEIEGAFGIADDAANIYKQQVSSRASFNRFLGRDEKGILEGLRSRTGEFRSIKPDERDYASAWEHAVNKQIGNDSLARRFLAGSTVDAAERWLRADPAGIRYAQRNPIRKRDPHRWAGTVSEQVESYTVGSDEIKAAALARNASVDDLVRLRPDAAARPIVHGEILAQTLGNSAVGNAFHRIIEGAYRKLGSQPTDVLSRQPYFDAVYQAEVKRLVDLLDGDTPLDEATLHRLEIKARDYALGQTKNLLYDLAEQSELARIVRFFMPFYSAWQETITRWAGIVVENPAFIARGRQVWSAPDKAGLVHKDQNGEEYIVLRVPEVVKDLPGIRGLNTQGAVRLNKAGFSLALQGTPGFGPIVQVPVNEIVKARPDLEDSLKAVLPFGPTQSLRDLILPATAKRAFSRVEGEENRSYYSAMMRIYFDKVTDFELGKRDTPPTYAEAKKEADSFFNLRMFANFFSPISPSFDSPYQLYRDIYLQLREDDPTTADEKFLDTYGPEYFALTQSLSRSMDGVPPTLEGWQARKKYKDLIEEFPDLGGLIVGSEGAGEFSKAVYDAQLAAKLSPGSGDKQRELPPFDEAAVRPNVRLGWIEYGRAMDLIDAERIQRGLPNLAVKAARDLVELKRAITAAIEAKYPEWEADRAVTDTKKYERRLEGMRKIAADNRLAQRADIAGLRDYLAFRDVVVAQLGAREAKTLDAASNQDLALAWDTITSRLVEKNLAFGDLYHRWLERDRLEAA